MRARVLVKSVGSVIGISAGFIACSSPDAPSDRGPGAAVPAAEEGDGAEEGTQPLAIPTKDICKILPTLAEKLTLLGGNSLKVEVPLCDYKRLAFHGYSGSVPSGDVLTNLFAEPFVSNNAYLCGLGDASGTRVDGKIHSLGGFGVESTFEVIKRDPARGLLDARRVAKFYLFGAGLNVGVQELSWEFPNEISSGQQPHLGSYKLLRSKGANWGLNVEATFPIGSATVTVNPKLNVRNPFEVDTNGAYPRTPASAYAAVAPHEAYSYSRWAACNGLDPQCAALALRQKTEISNATFVAQHGLPCAGDATEADGILPYRGKFGGASCAGQDFIHFDLARNWFHFGRPTSPQIVEWEPSHVLTSATYLPHLLSNATVWASLDVKVEFGVRNIGQFTVDTTTSIASRDGIAVTHQHLSDPDERGLDPVTVSMSMNAQSRAKLTGRLRFDSLLPLIPSIDIPFSVPLAATANRNWKGDGEPLVAAMKTRFREGDQTQWESYQVKGVGKPQPDAVRSACLTAKAVSENGSDFGDAAGWVRSVAEASADMVHPCHVRVCEDPYKLQIDMEWNADKNALGVTYKTTDPASHTNDPCVICRPVELDLCDAAGNVIVSQVDVGLRFKDGELPPNARCNR